MPRIKPNPRLRIYRRNLLLVFLTALLGLSAVHYALADRPFSPVENRMLRQRPQLSRSALADGSYVKDLSGYLADQFPFRDQMIRLKAGMDKFLMRQENNDVYIHSRDYLIEKFTPNRPDVIKEKAEAINRLADAHRRVRFHVMLVPNKAEILKDKLPPFAPVKSQAAFLETFYQMLSPRIGTIDLIPHFTDLKNNYLYFKSDHHWTQQGAFRAQEVFLKEVGLTPRTEAEYDIRKVAQDFLGSLSSKSGTATASPDDVSLYVPKDPEDLVVSLTEEQKKLTSLYQMDLVEGQDKYLVFLGGNYPVVRISTESPKDRRLMIIKDSYANAFVPFLTKEFNEITMVDLRYYTGDVSELLKEYLITDLLVLYNINTFNEDPSILNLSDSLPQVPAGEPVKPSGVSLASRLEGRDLYLTLKNNTVGEIKYVRWIMLEIKQGEQWRAVPMKPGTAHDLPLQILGASAAAEYLMPLERSYGELAPGTYRAIQTGEGFPTIYSEFTIP